MNLRYSALLTGLAIWLCAQTAHADETTDIQSLLNEQVIVTAASTAQRESAAPALSTTITADDIKTFGFRTIAQAIDFLSLGVFTGDPLRTPDIGSRGILFSNDNGKHFLLLINGHAVNDPLYGAARFDVGAGIPIELVDHVEVVLGPGSVLYGSNAMMGVINVITKNAASYSGVHVYGETELGRSLRVGAGTGYAFKLFGLPSELVLGMEYYDQYGPALDFPVQKFPTVEVFGGVNLPGEWGGRLGESYFTRAPVGHMRLRAGDLEVNLSASTYKRGVPYASGLYLVEFDDPQSFELDRALRIDVRHQATLSALLQLTSRAYADSFDYQRRLTAGSFITCQNVAAELCQHYDAGVARWLGIEERLMLNWLRDQTFVTALGIDVRERFVGAKQEVLNADSHALLTPTSGRLDDHGASIGPYIQQTWNPATFIDMNAGARLDIDDRFSAVLSPRGALVLRPFQSTTFKAIYSQAFRAPTWSETSIASHTVAPAPDLVPERVRSMEASAEQALGTQRLRLAAFATRWTDLVQTRPVSNEEIARLQASGVLQVVVNNIVQSSNVASINNYGVSLSWLGSSLERKLRYGANVTWAQARVHTEGSSSRLPATPTIIGNAHVAYSFGTDFPTLALAVQAMGTRPADRATATDKTLPVAPALADFRIAITGRVPKVPGLGYVLTGDYITADHSPYTAGPEYRAIPAVQSSLAMLPAPGYAPIDQLRIMLGLRLDFLTGQAAQGAEAP